MKIPLSVREIYEDKRSVYETLSTIVGSWIDSVKESKWHYESRIKQLESFALKFETGRFTPASIFDDFFAGMVVVPSHNEIAVVEELLRTKFDLKIKKPNDRTFATYSPDHFVFDDLRLYLEFNKDKFVSPKAEPLQGLVFEIQIKTFLQHAWSLSTHDLVYKSDNISWSKHRVAYQVKAMLENIELSISSAEDLSCNKLIDKQDKKFRTLSKIVRLVESKWESENLPHDKKRLSENIYECISKLNLSVGDLKDIIEESKCNSILSLSPYQSILVAIINIRPELFIDGNPNHLSLMITKELGDMLEEGRLTHLKLHRYVTE
ncbi:TPA: hypothetical protein OT143_003902 [Enterobacter kobei]|nr:hypothetical protein [Enterobacter kobei]